jgi:hypothetical protein
MCRTEDHGWADGHEGDGILDGGLGIDNVPSGLLSELLASEIAKDLVVADLF